MNIGKLGVGIAISALGGYAAGIPYGMGLIFLGVVLAISGASIVGWESIKK